MKNIKLIVSDLDGTLLPYGQENLSEKVKNCIRRIIECGVTFTVSSGRTYNELFGFLGEFSDRIYFTCCDGALTVKNGKVIYGRRMENGDIGMFFSKRSDDFSFVLHGAFENYSFGNIPSEAEKYNCIPVRNIFDVKEKIFKITSFGKKISLPDYCGIRTHWDGGDNSVSQYVNRYCNKSTALSDLQMRLMLAKYDTAVLGDRGNDVCMVKNAKYSYCIGNGCAELSDKCAFRFDCGELALDDIIGRL